MIPFPVQTLASQQAAGTLFNTYTTAKSVINATELYTFPANTLRIGSKLRISGAFGLSNIVTTPGTFTLQIMMGSVVVLTSSAIQMSTTANTLQQVEFVATLRLATAGSGTGAAFTGVMRVSGLAPQLGSGVANPTVTDSTLIVPTTPANGTGFDSTVAETLDFWNGFSISNAGNGIQMNDYTVEMLAGAG